MLRRIKVTGSSLSPEFKEGDFVLTSKIPLFFGLIKAGEIVVLDHPDLGRLIKRVKWVDRETKEVFVIGTHENSIDSRQFGPVKYSDLTGKVFLHIPKPDES